MARNPRRGYCLRDVHLRFDRRSERNRGPAPRGDASGLGCQLRFVRRLQPCGSSVERLVRRGDVRNLGRAAARRLSGDRAAFGNPLRAALQAFLQSSGVDTLFLTTALFNQLARELPNAFSSLRHLIFGGEVADASVVASILASNPPAHLINGYGPTENTTFTTWYEVDEHFNPGRPVPIGRPISNTKVYVLDRALRRFPWARLANCTPERMGWPWAITRVRA